MAAYYNENDPYAAQWLRNLIAAGHIAPGDVDERGIGEVSPDDLVGYGQCHFFAGIAGWSYALRLAGWPDNHPVWTGSCPCQPLSGAGQQKGHADERHLWPAFFALIAECRPPVVLGEQVASNLGREWLSGVRADLEYLGYAVGAADLPAACVGAPHIRQRLFWMGHSNCTRRERPFIFRQHRQEYFPSRPSLGDAWRQFSILRRGKIARRVGTSTLSVAYGFPGRMGRLRAVGNAIVPQVGAAFIQAVYEVSK